MTETEITTEKPRMRKRAAATAKGGDIETSTDRGIQKIEEPKERRPIEDEIRAMRTIDRALKDLNHEARARVLNYFVQIESAECPERWAKEYEEPECAM